jgi:N-terminal acetyltransferase B complex non-catalytic subunit
LKYRLTIRFLLCRIVSDAQQHIQKFIEFDPKSRNAHISLLDIILTGVKRGERTEDDLISACQNYFDQHKSKLYAFQDLRGVLETRDASVVHRVSQYCMDTVQDKPVSETLLGSMYAS